MYICTCISIIVPLGRCIALLTRARIFMRIIVFVPIKKAAPPIRCGIICPSSSALST